MNKYTGSVRRGKYLTILCISFANPQKENLEKIEHQRFLIEKICEGALFTPRALKAEKRNQGSNDIAG